MVYGDIYYYGVLFLTWVSKHEEEDFHAALGSFPFMGVCQNIIEDSFMGPCIFLLPKYGERFFLQPLTIFGSALLHKREIYSLSSMIYIGPNYMMETTISYVALGKDVFLTCMFI